MKPKKVFKTIKFGRKNKVIYMMKMTSIFLLIFNNTFMKIFVYLLVLKKWKSLSKSMDLNISYQEDPSQNKKK